MQSGFERGWPTRFRHFASGSTARPSSPVSGTCRTPTWSRRRSSAIRPRWSGPPRRSEPHRASSRSGKTARGAGSASTRRTASTTWPSSGRRAQERPLACSPGLASRSHPGLRRDRVGPEGRSGAESALDRPEMAPRPLRRLRPARSRLRHLSSPAGKSVDAVVDGIIAGFTETTRTEQGESQVYASSVRFFQASGVASLLSYAEPTLWDMWYLLLPTDRGEREREKVTAELLRHPEYAAVRLFFAEQWPEQMRVATLLVCGEARSPGEQDPVGAELARPRPGAPPSLEGGHRPGDLRAGGARGERSLVRSVRTTAGPRCFGF